MAKSNRPRFVMSADENGRFLQVIGAPAASKLIRSTVRITEPMTLESLTADVARAGQEAGLRQFSPERTRTE